MTKFFPMFIDIREKKVLIVGAGEVATRRVKKLLPFGCQIKVVAKVISDEIKEVYCENLSVVECGYDEMYLEDVDYCIAATDDEKLNEKIVWDCQREGILVNDASNLSNCDFYFPALIEKDDIIIGIGASGKDHTLVKKVREKLEEV